MYTKNVKEHIYNAAQTREPIKKKNPEPLQPSQFLLQNQENLLIFTFIFFPYQYLFLNKLKQQRQGLTPRRLRTPNPERHKYEAKARFFRLPTWMWTANADSLLSVPLFNIITIIFSTLELNDATKQKQRSFEFCVFFNIERCALNLCA